MPGEPEPGEAAPSALEVKAVREQAAKLGWQDTAARLAKVEAALEKAQQAQPDGDGK